MIHRFLYCRFLIWQTEILLKNFWCKNFLISTFYILYLRRNKVNPGTTEALALSLPPTPQFLLGFYLSTGVAYSQWGGWAPLCPPPPLPPMSTPLREKLKFPGEPDHFLWTSRCFEIVGICKYFSNYPSLISRKNLGDVIDTIYFSDFQTSSTHLIFFVLCSWIIIELEILVKGHCNHSVNT